MPDPVTGTLAAVSIGGSLLQSSSAKKGTKAQTQAADASIAEQRRQFETVQQLLRPYVNAGGPALQGLMNLAGLGQTTTNWRGYAEANPAVMQAYEQQMQGQQIPSRAGIPAQQAYGLGDTPGFSYQGGYSQTNPNRAFVGPDAFLNPRTISESPDAVFGNPSFGRGDMSRDTVAFGGPMSLEQFAEQYYQQNGGDISAFQNNPQAQAVAQIEGQPMFQAIARQGEDAILQNASATGGLRGGNTQGALARFRPQLLNQFIEQQYARLAGITELGQNAAAGVGSAGLSTGANISSLLSQQGLAQAAGAGAQGQIYGNLAGNLGGLIAGAIRPSGPSSGLVGSVNGAINQNPGLF
jgi:hypothetical protein